MKNKIFLFPISLAVIFFASIIIILSSVGQKNIIALPTPTPAPIPTDWKTYTNKKYGFEFQYPKDWEIRETEPGTFYLGKKGEKYYFEGSQEESAIYIGFWKPSKDSFSELFKDYQTSLLGMITVEKTRLGGVEAGYIKFFGNEIFTIYHDYETHTNIRGYSDEYSQTNVSETYSQIISTFKFIN